MERIDPDYPKILRKRPQRGFTLIEVLLAMGILAVALCTILGTYISSAVLVATAKNVNIATNAALGLMEEIRSNSFSQIADDYDGLNFELNGISPSRGVVYVNDTDPELLEVTVSVCWRQGNRVIGDDTNLNGVIDAGEHSSPDGIIDSPVKLTTLIANR